MSFKAKTFCCGWTNGFTENLSSVMRVMRFATNRGRSHFSLDSIDDQMTNGSKYPIKPTFGLYPNNHVILDINSMIPKCFMKKYDKDADRFTPECQLSQSVITDMGICPSFNPLPMSKLMKPSHFMDSFNKAYKEDMIANYSVKYGEKSGKTLKFYLVRTPKDPKWHTDPNDMAATFQLGISSSKEFFGMKSSSFAVKAGYKTIFQIEPTEIKASEDLRSISIEKRRCLFDDELGDLKLFKKYSQSGCEFEKQIQIGMEKCECAPWFIPTPFGKNYTICDLYGNSCFDFILKDFTSIKECLPSCNLLQFSQNQILEKIDAQEVCNNELTTSFNQISANLFVKKGLFLLFQTLKLAEWQKYPSKLTNETYNEDVMRAGFCQYMVKYHMAEVEVKFGNKKYLRTKMGVKVSFTDRLGVFGKNISDIKS